MSNDFETNRADAGKLIERFRSKTLPHFIDGRHDEGRSGKTFESIAPSDNSVIGKVAAGNADDIDAACKAASNAFEDWKNMPGKERKKLLHKVADAIIARARDIALVESYDSGQAIRFMSKAAIRGASVHTLRHTFCTQHAAAGTNLVVIQRAAGHASLTTTQRYLHLVDQMMEDQLEKNAL